MTTSELARRERIAPPTATRIVDALVRDGLVERRSVPADRRRTELGATPTGRGLMERGRARRIERLAGEIRPLEPGSLELLERALELLERLEASPEPEVSR